MVLSDWMSPNYREHNENIQVSNLPIIYSFRRCPYAIRARMAIRASGIRVELREIDLKNKVDEFVRISPKATVPVVQTAEGRVIEESIDIMDWALSASDPEGWLKDVDRPLIDQCDYEFKPLLDRYKYHVRYTDVGLEKAREDCCGFLETLDRRLEQKDWLAGSNRSLTDVAIFPFVRQFAGVDLKWLSNSGYENLNRWFAHWLEDDHFKAVMVKFAVWSPEQPSVLFPQ
ncbi:MAG: glutathione S-transferase [Gammaproteobacteria bacterium]